MDEFDIINYLEWEKNYISYFMSDILDIFHQKIIWFFRQLFTKSGEKIILMEKRLSASETPDCQKWLCINGGINNKYAKYV